MNIKIRFLWVVVLVGFALPLQSAPLVESKFTEVIKAVNIIASANKSTTPAKVNDPFKAPDLVRTGADSRAELTASDQTITRVGANTVFAFEPAGRNLRLEEGSMLFHSRTGKGGGTIKTGGASAAVLGTTIIVAATADGGFKFIVLEGRGKATLASGKFRRLNAGQMIFVLPGGKGFSEVLDINLGKLVSGSQLINGFSRELPSLALVNAAIQKQNIHLARGRAVDTGMSADQFAASPKLVNGLNVLDHNSYQSAIHPPLTAPEIARLTQAPGQGQGQGTGGLGGLGGSDVVIVRGPVP